MNCRKMFGRAADLLAPRHCVFCGVGCIDGKRHICNGCLDDLPWRKPFMSPTPGVFVRRIAPLNYEFPVDVAIKACKFHRKTWYAPAFGELLCHMAPYLADDIDALLPVPLHWFRQARRGFNQAALIATPLAKKLRLPIVHSVVRRRSTPYQSGLDASQRAANLADAFALRRRLAARHPLIVDDVVTTGATAEQLATFLHRHGVERVSLLTLAHR